MSYQLILLENTKKIIHLSPKNKLAGFTLIEVVVGIFVLAILSLALAGLSVISARSAVINEQRTVAQGIVTQELERLRALNYDDIGYATGQEPNGILPPSRTFVRNGQTYTIDYAIRLFDDSVNGTLGSTPTEATADYKEVAVTVGYSSGSRRLDVSAATYAVPPPVIKQSFVGMNNSIVLGADGLPVISHADAQLSTLRVTKCGNAACSSGNVSTNPNPQIISFGHTSIALGGGGFPIVGNLKGTPSGWNILITNCGNPACTSSNASLLPDINTSSMSLAVGPDQRPVIAYYDANRSDLVVVKCGNAVCSDLVTAGYKITTVDAVGDVGFSHSIAIGADNLPVISYYDRTNKDLKVVKCGYANCSAGNTITTVDAVGIVGVYTAIAFGADSFPVISYFGTTSVAATFGDLKVVKCGNAACSAGNTITTVDPSGAGYGGHGTRIAVRKVGSNPTPVISYYDTTGTKLKVLKCGNAACSAGNTITTVVSLSSYVNSSHSLTIGTDDRPVISYYGWLPDPVNGTAGDLRVIKCGNAACTAGNVISIVDRGI